MKKESRNPVAPTLAMLGERAGISADQLEQALHSGMSIDGVLQWIAERFVAHGKPIIRTRVDEDRVRLAKRADNQREAACD